MLKMQNEMEALKNAHESFKAWAQKQIRSAHQVKIPPMEQQLKEHDADEIMATASPVSAAAWANRV